MARKVAAINRHLLIALYYPITVLTILVATIAHRIYRYRRTR